MVMLRLGEGADVCSKRALVKFAGTVVMGPDGTPAFQKFAALQYFGYKPSAASTSITVQPLSTTLTKPEKTPEELEEEAYTIGWITTEIAVLAAMQFGPTAFFVTLLGSVALKIGMLSISWNSIQDLKSALLGAWVSLILGTVGTIKMIHSGLVSLACGFIEAATKVDFWKFIYKFVYIPINMVFLMLTLIG